MDIKHQLQLKATTEQVYEAISTQLGFEGWWSQVCHISSQVGELSFMKFVKEGRDVGMYFRIDELQVDKKVEWTCVQNGNPVWVNSKLSFEIEKTNDGCSLTFIHNNFDEKWKDTPPYVMTVDGWKFFMQSLKSFCETGKGQPWG
ncbi:MAG: SRPBCC domain-containing protein [Bacteroidota bacterium]